MKKLAGLPGIDWLAVDLLVQGWIPPINQKWWISLFTGGIPAAPSPK
jgi:hypothetical protein